MIPVNSMWGKHTPIESFKASAELLQTVDKKKPKLMPANPMGKENGKINILVYLRFESVKLIHNFTTVPY